MDTTRRFRLAALATLATLALPREAATAFDGPPPTTQDGRLTAQARLQAQQRTHPERIAAASRPSEPRAVPVPAALEIEVLDPNVDPLGNPAVLTRPTPDGAGVVVDIPPVALVHRYYYTGDRDFQGPMLPGGPTILVLNHPTTNERLYVEAMMLPGSPRVIYRRHSVEYDYGPQAITLAFGLHGRPAITYRNGTPFLVRARRARAHAGRSAGDLAERSGIPEAGRKVAAGTKNIAITAVDRVHDVGKAVTGPIVAIVRATPLSNVLTSPPEERAARVRDNSARQAASQLTDLDASISTIR